MIKTIHELRSKIDVIDREIVNLITRRQKLSIEIGDFKKGNGLKVYDKNREIEILDKLSKLGKENGVDPKLIYTLYREILKESHYLQRETIE